MKENMFRALFAAAIGALAAYAGILLVPLCVLAAVMIIDYATGIAAAWSCKLLSSRVGVKGIVKKVAYLALSDLLGARARRGGHFGQLLLRHDDLGLADNQRAALDSREPREIGNTSA